MNAPTSMTRLAAVAPDAEILPAARRWLVVEPIPVVAGKLPYLPTDIVVHARFEMVGPKLLGRIRPEFVLAPLITPTWDILDLAAILSKASFSGLLLARTRALPDIDMVLSEIRGLFPDLEVRIQIVPG